jgi:hypothetical protein
MIGAGEQRRSLKQAIEYALTEFRGVPSDAIAAATRPAY